MNHSMEIAQETVKVTAGAMLKAVRHATKSKYSGGVYFHAQAVPGRPSYSDAFIFDMSVTNHYFSSERTDETILKMRIPGSVRGGHTSKQEAHTFAGRTEMTYCEAYRPTKGFWSLISRTNDLESILELLPRDAQVALEVRLDYGTNQYLTNAVSTPGSGRETGLHCDHLYLVATFMQRGKQREMRFLIDTTAGAHNSARFGGPRNETDTTGRSDW